MQGAVSTFSRQDLDDCAHLTSYYALALANAQLQDAQRKADRQTKVAMDMMGKHSWVKSVVRVGIRC